MTCIVGLKHDGKVYLGCDSLMTDNVTNQVNKFPKILKKDNFLFGVAGYLRTLDLINYKLVIKPQDTKQTDLEYLCTDFTDSLIALFNDNYHIQSADDGKRQVSEILFGYRGELYLLDGYFQIVQMKDHYDAIGSGRDFALSAMATIQSIDLIKSMKPETQITKALEVSAKFCPTVCKPFKVMSI